MRVALIGHSFSLETGHGVDRYAADLLRYVRFVFPYIDVVTVNQRSVSGRFSWLLEDLLLARKIRDVEASVYHAVSPNTAFALLVLKKKPLVTTIHDLIPFRNARTRFYLTFEKPWFAYLRFVTKCATKSDMLLVPFEITKNDLTTLLGVEPQKIRVVHPAVDLARFSPVKLDGKFDNNSLLYVGSLDYLKGVDLLLQIYKRVSRELPDTQLRIVGKHGNWHHFQCVAHKIGIDHKIRFLGALSDVELIREYRNASVFVWPSRVGFGLQLLESIACGTPVVASNTQDIVEVLGEVAVTVNPLEIDEFAQQICRILTDNQYRKYIIKEGLKKINSYSWKAAALKIAEIYRELTNGS